MTDKIKKPKQKLELTWIGKDVRPRLEPRILLPNDEHSYHAAKRSPDGDCFDNKLIYGDNLLVLKSLEQDYSGKVKCIYIDPPYNTGSAFEHYDDGLEHSIWLRMMRDRLELLRTLLAEVGTLWISIDDKEVHYLKVLCDEIFGRNNFVSCIAVKMSTASGVKTSHRDKTIIKEKEYVLCYAKNRDLVRFTPQYIPKLDWNAEFQYFLNKNNSENANDWSIELLRDTLKSKNIPFEPKDAKFKKFVFDNADKIWRRAFIRNKYKEESQNNPDKILVDSTGKNLYYRGRQMYFFKSSFNDCLTEEGIKNLPSHLLGDFWTDMNTGKLFNEGGVKFRNGKKPEALICRIFSLATNEGDLVLDSFAGSGTTGAVAHKMKRKWIMVELGEHCYTHIVPRMKQVVDGTDKGGITQSVGWERGGGFRAYKLAPSMLKKDDWGYWIIDMDLYNPHMLAEAMCKHMGFKYAPDSTHYWMHGRAHEASYIYVTTQTMVAEQLHALNEYVGNKRSLLVCCSAFIGADDIYKNLTIKKIPDVVLAACEWARDDYSLRVNNLPVARREAAPKTAQDDFFNQEDNNDE